MLLRFLPGLYLQFFQPLPEFGRLVGQPLQNKYNRIRLHNFDKTQRIPPSFYMSNYIWIDFTYYE